MGSCRPWRPSPSRCSAEEQGSFLVGAAAGLTTTTDAIGFIGGVNFDPIHVFEAGFVAGVRHVNADAAVTVEYLCEPPDFSCFGCAGCGETAAATMYDNGLDVIFHAAGEAGTGMFAAAEAHSDMGPHVWGIGVDSDAYNVVPESQRAHVLTSMLKRVDVAVYETISEHRAGAFQSGVRVFDVANDGVGYSDTGGHVVAIQEQLGGSIVVPRMP